MVTELTRDIDVKIKIPFFHNIDRIVFCILIAMCLRKVVLSIKVLSSSVDNINYPTIS